MLNGSKRPDRGICGSKNVRLRVTNMILRPGVWDCMSVISGSSTISSCLAGVILMPSSDMKEIIPRNFQRCCSISVILDLSVFINIEDCVRTDINMITYII